MVNGSNGEWDFKKEILFCFYGMKLIFFSIKKGIPKNSFPYQIIDTHLDNLLSIIVVFLNI